MKLKNRILHRGLVAVTALFLSASPILAATKNVILMISDGQGFNTVTATNYFTGIKPAYESFPVKLGMQTYSAGKRGGYVGAPYCPSRMATDFTYAMTGATDSASAATAMYTGVKVYDNEVNYTPDSLTLETFFEKAARAGKSIGAVSTVQLTHATPVAVFGHNKSRNNYSEMAMEAIYGSHPNANNNHYDAVNYNGNLKVVMGTGHPLFDANGQSQTANYTYVGGEAAWNDLKAGVNGWTKVDTLVGFLKLMCGRT
ncbi:MAG TPA: alkaline phosphatase, partial [Deltaproteobacteria bacterium]|nr:alkaline phosphatase [Deltaproteobacteria bacterium]